MVRKLAPMVVVTVMNVGVWSGALALGSLFLLAFALTFTMVSSGFALRLLSI